MFPEERQADYDFALGENMTSDAFAQAVRGPKGAGPARQPRLHADRPSDAPSSAGQPVANQPLPEDGGSSLIQGKHIDMSFGEGGKVHQLLCTLSSYGMIAAVDLGGDPGVQKKHHFTGLL